MRTRRGSNVCAASAEEHPLLKDRYVFVHKGRGDSSPIGALDFEMGNRFFADKEGKLVREPEKRPPYRLNLYSNTQCWRATFKYVYFLSAR